MENKLQHALAELWRKYGDINEILSKKNVKANFDDKCKMIVLKDIILNIKRLF